MVVSSMQDFVLVFLYCKFCDVLLYEKILSVQSSQLLGNFHPGIVTLINADGHDGKLAYVLIIIYEKFI